MVDHKKTYQQEADLYELLVSREDYQGNILREIKEIIALESINVIDLGTGTGRVAKLLLPYVNTLLAMDMAFPMLKVAKSKLSDKKLHNWSLVTADHRSIPGKNAWADLVISGWSICYLADWYPESWEKELDKAMIEIDRVLKPGGTVLLLETQGTGFNIPHPPSHLSGYFKYLDQAGFSHSWIRTDYKFNNLDQSIKTTSAFFGADFGEIVRKNGWEIVPECTGLWWKVKPL